MTDQQNGPAQLGTTPAGQAADPIDAQTLGRLSHEQLQEAIRDAIADPAAGIRLYPELGQEPLQSLLHAAANATRQVIGLVATRHVIPTPREALSDAVQAQVRTTDALAEAVISAAAQ